MSTASRIRSPAMPRRIALAATIALWSATGIAATSLWRAVRLEPTPAAASPPAVATELVLSPVRARTAPDAPMIDNDPFSADRRRPAPPRSQAIARVASDTLARTVPPEAVRLLGTVIRPTGQSFVIYQLPSDVPKTLRVGESVGDLTLVDVVPGRATFRTRRGATVELYIGKTGT